MRYRLEVIETRNVDVVCEVIADNLEDAKEKARNGDTVFERHDNFSVMGRAIVNVEEDI